MKNNFFLVQESNVGGNSVEQYYYCADRIGEHYILSTDRHEAMGIFYDRGSGFIRDRKTGQAAFITKFYSRNGFF